MFSKSQFLLRGYFSLFIIFFFSLVPAQNNIYKINSFYITLNFAFTIIFFKYLPELLCIFSETARLMFLSNWLSFHESYKPIFFLFCVFATSHCTNLYMITFTFAPWKTAIVTWSNTLFLYMIHFVEKERFSRVIYHCFWTYFKTISCASSVDIWQSSVFWG